MNGSGETFTVSITSIAVTSESLKMNYLDVKANNYFLKEIIGVNNEMIFL